MLNLLSVYFVLYKSMAKTMRKKLDIFFHTLIRGAAVVWWLSSWIAEQEAGVRFPASPLGCTDRFHAIFHMTRSLKKADFIYIGFLLFYHIELYINKILSSCTFIIYKSKGFHSNEHICNG